MFFRANACRWSEVDRVLVMVEVARPCVIHTEVHPPATKSVIVAVHEFFFTAIGRLRQMVASSKGAQQEGGEEHHGQWRGTIYFDCWGLGIPKSTIWEEYSNSIFAYEHDMVQHDTRTCNCEKKPLEETSAKRTVGSLPGSLPGVTTGHYQGHYRSLPGSSPPALCFGKFHILALSSPSEFGLGASRTTKRSRERRWRWPWTWQRFKGVKGSKETKSLLQLPFALLFATCFTHEYVCLWHPLPVLADDKVHVEATAVKWIFCPSCLELCCLRVFAEPVTKSWWMTTWMRRQLWVEEPRFATLRPHEGRLSAKAVAPASRGRWFFNVFAVAHTTRRMSCKAAWVGSNTSYPRPLRWRNRLTPFQFKSSVSSKTKMPPAKPPKPA